MRDHLISENPGDLAPPLPPKGGIFERFAKALLN